MIKNGKDTLLSNNSGTLPNMSSSLSDWFQPMVFVGIDKTVVNHLIREERVNINFRGIWQPMTERKIALKPEGQRSWRWFTCHSSVDLVLNTDEVICYLNKNYRVMGVLDYRLYGFVEYHLVEDYTA